MIIAILEKSNTRTLPRDPFRILSGSNVSDDCLWGIQEFHMSKRREWSDKTYSYMDINAVVRIPKDNEGDVCKRMRTEINKTIDILRNNGVKVEIYELDTKDYILA